KAINEGIPKEVQFKTKNLNIWTDSSMAWLNDETWMKCSGVVPDLTGKLCYGGLDLAATEDTNAFTLIFPKQEGLETRCSLHYFWLPEEVLNKKTEAGDYAQWARDGFIKTTEGDVMDHRFITKDISDTLTKYQVKAIAFDRYLAYHGVVQELMDEGAPMVQFGQGYKDMSPPTKEMGKIVKSGELRHGGNPVMRWMVGNVVITMNPAEDIKMDKSKVQNKIDGPVSMVMALGMEMAKPDIEDGGSIYDSGEVIL
ncbi:MAG: hypothetical protein JKY53_14710, partial [Flavobacteriales bacterium]|nr:hypothetical protein [Flavobacteriales bacterium]